MQHQVDRESEVMRWTYGLVPVVAGADKFTNLLTDWEQYLSPTARRALPVSARTFMRAVGIIEIAAGALVLNRKTAPVGAYVVGGWLGAIALNLVANRSFDVAVRDIVMSIGAVTLARRLQRATREVIQRREMQPPAQDRTRVAPGPTPGAPI